MPIRCHWCANLLTPCQANAQPWRGLPSLPFTRRSQLSPARSVRLRCVMGRQQASNLQPEIYKIPALPIELWRRGGACGHDPLCKPGYLRAVKSSTNRRQPQLKHQPRHRVAPRRVT